MRRDLRHGAGGAVVHPAGVRGLPPDPSSMLKTPCLLALVAAPLLAGAQDAPARPALALPGPTALRVDSKAKFEPIEYKTRDKHVVHAEFYAPRKAKGRAPAVLLVHDAGSTAQHLAGVAEALQRKGFAVLVPDLRGHGASVTPEWDWTKTETEEEKAQAWTFAMRDLESSTDWLREQDSVHNSNLSVVGVGAGSVLAARYAVRDENARAVVLIAPEPEAFGFNLLQDIIDLGGLPVMIMATDAAEKDAARIRTASAKANDGFEYVVYQRLTPKDEGDVLSDRRLNTELHKFLEAQAMPER